MFCWSYTKIPKRTSSRYAASDSALPLPTAMSWPIQSTLPSTRLHTGDLSKEVSGQLTKSFIPLTSRGLVLGLTPAAKLNEPYYHQSKEPFWENHRSAEWGHCWENAEFGGRISQNLGNHDSPLIVSEWPSFRHRYPEV